MPTPSNIVNSIWARIVAAQKGVAVGNAYALLNDAGQFAPQTIGNGHTYFVSGQTGSDANDGLAWDRAFATMAKALSVVASYDQIYVNGIIKEQVVAPQDIFDVTIIGACNRPRQATDGGVPTGGGASWLPPSSPTATTPLLKLREQSWTIVNMMFAPHTNSAGIRLSRAEIASDMDGSHASIIGCYFLGGSGTIGIEDVGGCGQVLVDQCRFQGLGDTAIKGISTGIAVPLGWEIRDSRFSENLNDIKMSLRYASILRNRFMSAGSGATNKVISTNALTGGEKNHILLNQFSNTEAQIAPGNGYTGVADDVWMNYVNDQAALAFGQPA